MSKDTTYDSSHTSGDTMTRDPIVEWVVNRFNESKNYYAPLFDKFQDWDKQYFSIPEEKKYGWQSNVFVPATYKAVKTLLARIVAALFSTTPPFDVVGVEKEDKPGEIPKKKLISYQFDKTKIFDKFVKLLLQGLVRGTSVGKVFWRRDYSYIPRTVEYTEEVTVTVDEQGKKLKGKKKRKVLEKKQKIEYDQKVTYEGPDFDVIDICGAFFPDPYNIEKGYKIHRVVRTGDYIKKNSKKYENVQSALDSQYPGDDRWAHSRLERVGLSEPKMKGATSDNKNKDKSDRLLKKYELLECHCEYDINNDGVLEDCILTICNRTVLLKKRINPYPDGVFVKIGFMPVLGEYFWQGVCELVEPLQKELNDKRNQRMDNVNQVLQKVLTYVEDAIDPEIIRNFVFAPGARLPVKDVNALQWVEPPDVTASSYNEEQLLVKDIQETSGAVNVLMPASGQNDIHRTASGLFMLKGEAETSIKLIVQMIESMGLAEIAKKYDILNKELMTQPLKVRILGQDGLEYDMVKPQDIRYYNCDFVFKGASAYVNREIRLAQIAKLVDSFGKIPVLMQQLDPQKLAKMLTNTLGFQEEEIMRTQTENVLQQGGLNPELDQNGMGGQPGQGLGMDQNRLSQLVGGGEDLSNIQNIMQSMQEGMQ